MSLTTNPFGTHVEDGVYLAEDGSDLIENNQVATFSTGDAYLIHKHQDEWDLVKFRATSGPDEGQIKEFSFGPKAFGALFFFITGFHGFHVFSGILFLAISSHAWRYQP